MDNEYKFSIKNIKYEIFFGSEHVEIYELENPSKTGFIFPDKKSFTLFVNNVTDILEKKITEEEK